jgi:hypothetical protein
MASHSKLDERDEMHKVPYLAHLLLFKNRQSEISLIAHLGLDGVQRGHEHVYWFRQNVPMSSGELFVLLVLGSVVGVTNNRERDELLGL